MTKLPFEFRLAAGVAVLLAAALLLPHPIAASAAPEPAPRKTLKAFTSDAELAEWIKKMQPPMRRESSAESGIMYDKVAPAAPPAAAMAPAPQMMAKSEARASSAPGAAESVTNVQTAGVDEGGIVKVHGDHLVILRRGRLFTVAVGSGNLAPTSVADAYGPGGRPDGAWYDEMLISQDTVVVIGYSYARGGTEIGLFDIDAAGHLAHRATYHMRSNDYYSSRNYASRLIGNKLIFYTPLYINAYDPFAGFPAVRRWHEGALPEEFRRVAPATRIYRTDENLPPGPVVLHSVTTCEIGKRDMDCKASAVLGPAGRVFYVSANAVYVWATAYNYSNNQQQAKSGVFRLPLDGGAPSALKVAGSPVDQFSFLESEDGYLNVLVRSNGRGDGMWAGEQTRPGDMALLRAPLSSFGDGNNTAPATSYQTLPSAGPGALQNRFIGPYLLYGAGNSWGAQRERMSQLYAVRWNESGVGRDSAVQALPLTHSVDRIEALGNDAIVVGTQGRNLHFSSLRLGSAVLPVYRYTRENAAQGETRSHGFFYKPDGEDSGTVGLPIVGSGRPGYKQLREGSAAVLYLHNEGLHLDELGALEARGGEVNDNCVASCVDWYGNARPLFLKSRVFALMGYELVEGRIRSGSISEVRRVSFAPEMRIGFR